MKEEYYDDGSYLFENGGVAFQIISATTSSEFCTNNECLESIVNAESYTETTKTAGESSQDYKVKQVPYPDCNANALSSDTILHEVTSGEIFKPSDIVGTYSLSSTAQLANGNAALRYIERILNGQNFEVFVDEERGIIFIAK